MKMQEEQMNTNSKRTQVLALAGLLIIIILGIIAVTLFQSEADDVSQSATPGNATPSVDTVTTAITSGGGDQSSITLTEGSTKTVYIHGQATDNNGCVDIDTASNYAIKVYRTNHASGSSCSADKNDCYAASIATPTGCSGSSDLNALYEGTVALEHFADPTDAGAPQAATTWTASVVATDDSAAASTAGTDTFEVASLLALDVTSSAAYGTIALGADSAQQTITFTNTGNRAIDTDQTASGDMSCATSGTIPVGNAHLSLTNGFTYGTGDQALTTTTTGFDLTLAQRTDENTASTKASYLILRMPSSGVKGACSNTVTFTAKADA